MTMVGARPAVTRPLLATAKQTGRKYRTCIRDCEISQGSRASRRHSLRSRAALIPSPLKAWLPPDADFTVLGAGAPAALATLAAKRPLRPVVTAKKSRPAAATQNTIGPASPISARAGHHRGFHRSTVSRALPPCPSASSLSRSRHASGSQRTPCAAKKIETPISAPMTCAIIRVRLGPSSVKRPMHSPRPRAVAAR